MQFKLHAPYEPAGDQPQAIEQLADLYNRGTQASVLLGVTGSGKTFTMANLVEKLQRPTLVISHNKTLAAQLYAEFKGFFPENAVEYFVSYYDYYQPEAYLPVTDVYIEKDLSINDEIEKLRLSTSSALLSGRRDVLVVSSVSCLYGIGNPDDFHANTITLRTGEKEDFNKLLYRLVDALYSRNENEFKRGTFRVRGDVVDVYLAYDDIACRIAFWGNTIDSIERLDPLTGGVLERVEGIAIYPASAFVTTKERKEQAIRNIQDDLTDRVSALKEMGKHLEAKRLLDRVEFDIEMMRELGYCSGIENYSRYFDGRAPGTRPFCLLDYFPEDFLVIVDESHVTLPQVRAMYGGDRSRKQVLIEYGFRLPAAADNRPLTFDEFDSVIGQRLYVSATPADYELQRSEGLIVEQVVRPTGLLDPPIEVRGTEGQIDNLVEEIRICAAKDQRVLVTTLTKRMAEELHKFLQKIAVRCTYIHSDIETLERIRILEEFQKGYYDVLIGVNLLREWLDLPQVSLVAILDADKEGFLRSERALTQTAGRAARNVEGRVVMYADKITDSMARTIEETERRRSKQIRYNREHGITPTQIARNVRNTLDREYAQDGMEQMALTLAEDPVMQSMTPQQLEKAIATARHRMEEAAQKLDFITAAKFRDEMYILEKFKK
jgi:excinuclease ABC subunit B